MQLLSCPQRYGRIIVDRCQISLSTGKIKKIELNSIEKLFVN